MFGDNLDRIISGIEKNYEADEIFFTKPGKHFPSRAAVEGVLKNLRRVMFPGYFGPEMLTPLTSPEYFIGETLIQIERDLREQIVLALTYTSNDTDDEAKNSAGGQETSSAGGAGDASDKSSAGDTNAASNADNPINVSTETHRALSESRAKEIYDQTSRICTVFFDELPGIQRILLTDVQALYDGDPAAGSKEEVIFSYPGLYAIFVYRIAHVLYDQHVPIIPRIMTELAHSDTGIDIGAGATIGEHFFIDHGTGVVIGETTEIGDNVKLYQGVTLGALSTRGGQRLAGVKRHPTIEDNVTIYSNASVLGGETVIGEGSVIAGSTFVVSSVPPHSRVSVKEQEIKVRGPEERD